MMRPYRIGPVQPGQPGTIYVKQLEQNEIGDKPVSFFIFMQIGSHINKAAFKWLKMRYTFARKLL